MTDEHTYRQLFDLSPDAILIMQGDRFVDCNPAAVRMLRFPDKQSVLEAHPADISPRDQPDGQASYEKAETFLAIAAERGSHTFEWTHTCADGEALLVEVQLTVVRSGEKPLLHVVWRDISERRRLEAELRQAQRLEAVGRLAGGIAHDFNNLLVVILSHAELLQQDLEAGRSGTPRVGEIRSAADRAAALTGQLLAFSRGQPAQSRPTDMSELVRQLGTLLERLIGEHIELELELEAEPLTVVADPSQLEQVVVNLSANGRDAMPAGGKLRVSVRRRDVEPGQPVGELPAGTYVALSVSDSGQGMTAEQREHAFDPFYTTKSLEAGTGLGLATVHAIARRNGGHASIESAAGRGTVVQVLFPLSDREPVPLRTSRSETRPAGGGETILVVEDEPAIREILEVELGDMGYKVLTARDGEEALERLSQSSQAVDLVVTDVVMPRVSGPELVKRLAVEQPRLRVLFMSGYSETGDLNVSDDVETAVLQKPFTPTILQTEIRRILDQ